MAILTGHELSKLRKVTRNSYAWDEIDFTKPDINAAFQAMEDWYQAHKVDAATRMDAATEPVYTFSSTQKKVIASGYFALRFDTDKGG
jgi:hypothetical protein